MRFRWTCKPTNQALVNTAIQFQSNTFTGQVYDYSAGDLTGSDSSGALGGPKNVVNLEAPLLAKVAANITGAGLGLGLLPIPPTIRYSPVFSVNLLFLPYRRFLQVRLS